MLTVSRQPAPVDAKVPPATDPTFDKTKFSSSGTKFELDYVPNGPMPVKGDVSVVLRVHIDFKDFTRADMRKEPFRSHRFTRAERADFKWTAAEKTTFGADFQNSVATAWSKKHELVTKDPTFAEHRALVEVKVDSQMRLDVDRMITAASAGDTGLVFFNNPNNPTATVHGAKTVTDMVAKIRKASPATVILIDEAYHDYVTDPSYETAIPLALSTPNVFVARTFSKAYGMAGMRIGYAIGMADTMKPLAALKMPYNVSVFGVAAAIASLNDPQHIEEERKRNTDVRAFTVQALKDMGAKPADSQGNFLFADIGRPAAEFRDACAKQGVMVGRDFPPFEKTHCRISIGTMDEMKKAVEVFRAALKAPTTTTSGEKGGR